VLQCTNRNETLDWHCPSALDAGKAFFGLYMTYLVACILPVDARIHVRMFSRIDYSTAPCLYGTDITVIAHLWVYDYQKPRED